MNEMSKFEGGNVWPENLFKLSDIVALGETHGEDDDKIISFINQFGNQLAGVFSETTVNLQPDIDLYLQEKIVSDNLERLFEGAKREGKNIRNGMLMILDKLRDFKLKMYCIDSSKIQTSEYKNKSGVYYLKGESRDSDMFENIKEQYSYRPGKYAVICGGNHLDNRNGFDTKSGNLGDKLRAELPDKSEQIILS